MMTTLICLLSIALTAAIAFATRQPAASQQYESIPVPVSETENLIRRNRRR